MPMRCCQFCNASTGKLKRCRSCRLVWYCSVDCQRSDWNAHKQACRATRELTNLLASSSMEQAHRDFALAQDQVNRIQNDMMEEKKQQEEEEEVPVTKAKKSASPETTAARKLEVPELTAPTKEANETKRSIEETYPWSFYVQDMPNVSCFQVQLELSTDYCVPPDEDDKIALSDWNVSLQPLSSDRTRVLFGVRDAPLLRIEFPVAIRPGPRLYPVTDRVVSVRLEYEGVSNTMDSSLSLQSLSSSQVNHLACRVCLQSLFQAVGEDSTTRKIQRVARLPSGQWEDMSDYLICYPGTPAVDFGPSSTNAMKGSVWYDDTVVVVHKEDVDSAVSVLAIAGYGESERDSDDSEQESVPLGSDPTIRGQRPWRPSLGGATLACSQCATVFGWAPLEQPDTYRFLRHCMTGENDEASASCTRFVAREMIRHAETRAMFAFCVVNEFDEQCLLLRLLSWDTQTATSTMDGRLQWRPMAQMVHEQCHLSDIELSETKESSLTWMWNNTDWCCPPPTDASRNTTQRSATPRNGDTVIPPSLVRLYLSQDEFKQVTDDLEHSGRWYSDAVVQATILAQTGRLFRTHDKMGLAAIPLSN